MRRKTVTDDWQEPGKKLRAAREAKGLSVADVCHQVRIPRRVIEALENDDYGSFPSPTYAKSFLSQYAEFVGVDPSEWLDFFEPVVFSASEDVLSMVEQGKTYEPRAASHHRDEAEPIRRHSVVPTLMLILLSGGLVYGVVEAFNYANSHYGDKNSARQEAPQLQQQAPAQAEISPAPTGVVPVKPATKPASAPTEVAVKPEPAIPRAIIVD